jgi:hypothetical protein
MTNPIKSLESNSNNANNMNLNRNSLLMNNSNNYSDIDMNSSEADFKIDENYNESNSSIGDLSDDDDEEDINIDNIQLPKFQDKIEYELLCGDINKILKVFVRDVADFYVKNNIPINKSKHYKRIAIALFKKYDNLRIYFEKEAQLLNFSNSVRSSSTNTNFKTIQAYVI